MMIETMRPSKVGDKEIKIKLPTHLVLRLQALRILQGQSMHRTIREALEAYFATQPHR